MVEGNPVSQPPSLVDHGATFPGDAHARLRGNSRRRPTVSNDPIGHFDHLSVSVGDRDVEPGPGTPPAKPSRSGPLDDKHNSSLQSSGFPHLDIGATTLIGFRASHPEFHSLAKPFLQSAQISG